MEEQLELCPRPVGLAAVAGWVAVMASAWLILWDLGRRAGSLEQVVANAPPGAWPWAAALVLATLVPTALVFWFVPPSLCAVRFSGDGITLVRLGYPAWRIPWSDYLGWRWQKSWDGQMLCVQLVRKSGSQRRIEMRVSDSLWVLRALGDPTSRTGGLKRRAHGYGRLLSLLRQWAPQRGELPARIGLAPPEWLAWITLAFDPIGLACALLLLVAWLAYLLTSLARFRTRG